MNSPNKSPTDKFRILVVDDQPDIVSIIESLLDAEGYQVLTASGGYEALRIAESEEIDLVISDINMPAGSGIQLLSELRRIDPNHPLVILISGFFNLDEQQCKDMGALTLISKPFTRQTLLKEVSFALASAG